MTIISYDWDGEKLYLTFRISKLIYASDRWGDPRSSVTNWQLLVRVLHTRSRGGPKGRIYEGIRGLLVNNEVFIWNCVSWKSSPFLFRVSPEIYEHLERHRGFGPVRGPRATKWTATRTTVRHISIPRREQQRLFPRSVLHYISTINRTTGTKLLSAPTNGLESTGNDTWFMVLLQARATALEGPFKEELVRLQVRRAIARACTAKCVCRRGDAGPLLHIELFENPRSLGYSVPRCTPTFRNSLVRSSRISIYENLPEMGKRRTDFFFRPPRSSDSNLIWIESEFVCMEMR